LPLKRQTWEQLHLFQLLLPSTSGVLQWNNETTEGFTHIGPLNILFSYVAKAGLLRKQKAFCIARSASTQLKKRLHGLGHNSADSHTKRLNWTSYIKMIDSLRDISFCEIFADVLNIWQSTNNKSESAWSKLKHLTWHGPFAKVVGAGRSTFTSCSLSTFIFIWKHMENGIANVEGSS